MISEFFFISCKSNKRNSSVLYEFTDKWPGLLWKHLALKRLSADFCHYKLWLLHLYTWRCEELTRLTCRMPRRCVLLKLSFFGCAISGCALTFAGINLLVYLDFPSLMCLKWNKRSLLWPNFSQAGIVIIGYPRETELTQSETLPTAITDSIILSKGTWSINKAF